MPYSQFEPSELQLTDHLAIDRTVLANERTLLAYGRTAIVLVASGATLLKHFDEADMQVAGVALIALGGVAAVVGIWRFLTFRRRISRVHEPEDQPPAPPSRG